MVEVRANLIRTELIGNSRRTWRGRYGSDISFLRPGASRNSMSWIIWARHGVMVGPSACQGHTDRDASSRRLDGATLWKREGQPNTMKATANASSISAWDGCRYNIEGGNKAGKTAAQRLRATPAVSRANSRSEGRAKAVGVGSTAWFGWETGEAEGLGGLQVHDKLNPRGLLHGQVGGLGPLRILST